MNFKVIITKDEDGFFVASVPYLPGCHTQGKSVEEAMKNIKEAITGYLDIAKKYGDPIPSEDLEIIEATVKVPVTSR